MAVEPPATLLPIPDCPALVLDGVSVSRGGRRVLDGVDVTIGAGTALILKGPNGAGKTTLLRTIAGLQPPARGRISPGADSFAYASHADGLKATLSVAENLRFWARIFGTRDIGPALEAFELGALRDRMAATLSAGQRRRLGLARMALTGRPVWLFDEPTVSLDQETTERFARIVDAHLARGGIAVIATHIPLGLGSTQAYDLTHKRARPELGATGSQDAFADGAGEDFL